MTRTLHRLFKGTVTAVTALIMLLALLSIAVRLLLPHADGLRNSLLTHLSDTLGVQVEVDSLSLQLRGLAPVLRFTDAKLLAPEHAAAGSDSEAGRLLLSARTLGVDLDLLATLQALKPRIDAISLEGAEIQVLQDEDGHTRVLGLDAMQGNDALALDFFLREGRFRLLNSQLIWRDQRTAMPAQTFVVEIAELANRGQQHDLRVQASRLDAPALNATKRDAARPRSTTVSAGSVDANEVIQTATPNPATPNNDQLEILAQLDGQAEHPERWSGQLYLNATGSDLGRIADGRLPGQLGLSSSDFRIESWNQLEQGQLTASLTRLEIGELALNDAHRVQDIRLGDLAGLAHWQQQAQGWRLDLNDLRLPGQGASTPASASLRYRRASVASDDDATVPDDDASSPDATLFAEIDALRLEPIARIITVIAPELPDSLIALSQGRLHGRARNLAVHMGLMASGEDAEQGQHQAHRLPPDTEPSQTPLTVSDWRLRTEIEDLGIDASASSSGSTLPPPDASIDSSAPASTGTSIPPFSGLDLNLDLGPRGGYASISSSDARIDLQPLFARPHRFSHLEGDFAWRMMPAGSIHLWTRAFSANTQYLETITRLSLCLHPSGANPFIDLHTHLRDGQIAALPYWLPVGIMDDRLEDWLERAIVAGRLESGDLLLRGPLERFPFDDQEGRFILELRGVDGVLDYGVAAKSPGTRPGLSNAEEAAPLSWPPLRQVAAMVRFDNRSLEIEVPSAEILNSRVENGHLSMSNLWQPAYLEINARGEGPLADGLHVLATTPLAHRLGGLAATAEVSGDGGIQLKLGVPLNRALPFRYAGELTWDPGPDRDDVERSLRINGTDLHFTQITGRLRFDETGINAEGIRARLGRQPLEVDVETLDGGTDNARTEIDLQGRTAIDRLAETLPSDLWSLASGALDWQLGLSLSNRDAAQQRPPIDFTLSSNLQGIGLSLPAPIGKSVGERRPLRLSGRFEDQWPLKLALEYGEMGSLMEVDRKLNGAVGLQRLAIDLSDQPTTLPTGRSIEIGGTLEQLELMPWLDWIAQADINALQGSSAQDGLRLLPVQMQVQDLRVDALQLTDLTAVLTPESGGAWDIRFNSNQTGNCQIRLPAKSTDRNRSLQLRLEQLDLEPLVETDRQPNSEGRNSSRADPRRLGGLEIEIERLQYGDDLLGQLRILGQPQPNGLRFEQLSLDGPHVDATGSGEWLIDSTDYIESSLQINAESSAVGKLLRESGFYSALSGAPGELQLDLSWPGGPSELSLARARGIMEIEIGSGRMLEMEPGVGRMLGILNTSALGRRLSLDFSDVFEEGFSFDSITGEIAIGSGEATIRDLNIMAPPADIRITGRTDLIDGRLDQDVEVTPKIGVGLALAGAVAGGPVVGAAVFLADKVTDGAVERLGRYAYKVTGPWRDPVIRRVGTGGSPSVSNLFVDEPVATGSAAASADLDAGSETISRQSSEAEGAAPAAEEEPTNPFLEDF